MPPSLHRDQRQSKTPSRSRESDGFAAAAESRSRESPGSTRWLASRRAAVTGSSRRTSLPAASSRARCDSIDRGLRFLVETQIAHASYYTHDLVEILLRIHDAKHQRFADRILIAKKASRHRLIDQDSWLTAISVGQPASALQRGAKHWNSF